MQIRTRASGEVVTFAAPGGTSTNRHRQSASFAVTLGFIRKVVLAPAAFVWVAASLLAPAAAQDQLWVRQIGSAATDGASRVVVDASDNVYIVGDTRGSVGGPNAGGADIFLAKYNPVGTLLWARQTGSTANDLGSGIAVDAAGNLFITGSTQSSLSGANAGGYDNFLAKYDAAGNLLWLRQSGTPADDSANSIALDRDGNVYLTGYTAGNLGGPLLGSFDIFLSKYDTSGNLLWSRQTGTPGADFATGVSIDGTGNAYITGYTSGSLGRANAGNFDIFLAKYDPSGTQLWVRQFGGAAEEQASGVAVDGDGNAYITGYTRGNLGAQNISGAPDIILVKYDTTGTQVWLRQLRSTGNVDIATDVTIDSGGNVYITGYTDGTLAPGRVGGTDLFTAKYNALGTLLWIRQTGSAGSDFAFGVAVDRTGNTYITGLTSGSLSGPNAGSDDIFLIKYGTPPCTSLADIAGGTGGNAPDGIVDGADFIAFINSFATGDPTVDPKADVAGGGPDGLSPDGIIDGSDFIAFINAFSAGC